ncbi:hypothetical protein BDZ89DRAFT_1059727 [Hymenopellis radicata]|nr:hypothetical protein BDZ89DRAFT_1059727 [Hymenopellis radicata]
MSCRFVCFLLVRLEFYKVVSPVPCQLVLLEVWCKHKDLPRNLKARVRKRNLIKRSCRDRTRRCMNESALRKCKADVGRVDTYDSGEDASNGEYVLSRFR